MHVYIDFFSVFGSNDSVGGPFHAVGDRNAAVFHFTEDRFGSSGEQVYRRFARKSTFK